MATGPLVLPLCALTSPCSKSGHAYWAFATQSAPMG